MGLVEVWSVEVLGEGIRLGEEGNMGSLLRVIRWQFWVVQEEEARLTSRRVQVAHLVLQHHVPVALYLQHRRRVLRWLVLLVVGWTKDRVGIN